MEGNNNTEESTSERDKMGRLYDKNSDKLYAPKQLLPQSDYDMRDREIFERRVSQIHEITRWRKRRKSEIF